MSAAVSRLAWEFKRPVFLAKAPGFPLLALVEQIDGRWSVIVAPSGGGVWTSPPLASRQAAQRWAERAAAAGRLPADAIRCEDDPQPVPSLPRGLRYRIERVRGTVTYHLRYRLLGDVILARLAPASMRAAAWVQGFEFGCGARRRQSWWLNTLPECEEGNVRAFSVMPREGTRLGLVDPDAWSDAS